MQIKWVQENIKQYVDGPTREGITFNFLLGNVHMVEVSLGEHLGNIDHYYIHFLIVVERERGLVLKLKS